MTTHDDVYPTATDKDKLEAARQSRVQSIKARYLAGETDDKETLQLLVMRGVSVPVAVELIGKWSKERGE